MTTPNQDRLSRSAQEHLELISEGFQRNETKDQIQARIRAFNLERGLLNRKGEDGRGIRDQFLTESLRFLRGEEIQPEPIQRFTNVGKSPDPRRAPLSKGPILRRFSYNVGIRDTATGKIVGGVTVSSNTRRSISNIKAQAAASIAARGVENYADEDDIPDNFALDVLGSLEASSTIL